MTLSKDDKDRDKAGVGAALPCPFCGSSAYFTRTKNGTQMAKIGCAACGVEMKCAVLGYGEDAPLSKDILSAWNQRADAAYAAYAAGKAAGLEEEQQRTLTIVTEVANESSRATSFDWNLACRKIDDRIRSGGSEGGE